MELTKSVEGGLQRRGLSAVRILVTTSTATGAGSVVLGLHDLDDKTIKRTDAEWWIEQQDKRAAIVDSRRFWGMLLLTALATVAAIVGAFAAVLAAIEGLPSR